MYYVYLFHILGFFLFLFIFWKKLKEDYLSGQVFSAAFIILLTGFAGFALSRFFFNKWWFWAFVIGSITGLIFDIWRFKFRLYETVEALGISYLPWLSLTYLADSIANNNLYSLGASVFLLLLAGLYLFLNSRYKEFTWYASGRAGFAGLTTVGVFFLTRGVFAIVFPYMLSFVDRYEAIISGIFAFIVFFMVYNLSGKE